MKESFKKNTQLLVNSQELRNNLYSDWLKNLLTISTAILAVFISIKLKKSESFIESVFYLSTIIFSCIGIFSGVIVLHSYVRLVDKEIELRKEHILMLLEDDKGYELVKIDLPIYHKVFMYICYISLFLSMISLVIYGFIKEM